MKKLYPLFGFAGAVIAAILIITLLYKDVHPLGALKLTYSRDEIEKKAALIAGGERIPLKGYYIVSSIKNENKLVRQVEQSFGIKKGNELLREKIPGGYWNVSWALQSFSFNFGNGDGSGEKLQSNVYMNFDLNGNLIKYYNNFVDSSKTAAAANETMARRIAERFTARQCSLNFQRMGDSLNTGGGKEYFNFAGTKYSTEGGRNEYIFTWDRRDEYLKDSVILSVTVSGRQVKSLEIAYVVPSVYESDSTSSYKSISVIVFYSIIFIVLLFVAYKKIKAIEISFRLALIMSLIVALTFGIDLYSQLSNKVGMEVLLPLFLGTLFYGGGLFLIWAASETVCREVWKDKLLSIDLATKGYFMHSKVGKGILHGITYGLIIMSVWLLLLFVAENILNITSVKGNTNSQAAFFNSVSPVLSIINENIYGNIYLLSILFLFVMSGIKSRFISARSSILIGAVVWGFVIPNDVSPLYANILLQILMGILFVSVFIRHDALTALFSLITFDVVNGGAVFFTSGNPYYMQSGYMLIFFTTLLIIFAVVSLYTKDRATDYENITPAFVKNITERQRLQRELEIAREVQMSFLPHKNPEFAGLDIASKCLPANEVGGDYYDFVQFGGNRLGVIIGDVSGKGTQAAFYMTLTKGFLKALSKAGGSPSEVITKMNELFYENVERGTFISMIYGVFNLDKNEFIFTRAGHNPVITKGIADKEVRLLNPRGLALGLEKGVMFARTITEETVKLNAGDIFVFYTDGFSEAMNKANEEFGEERIVELVKENSGKSAEEILQEIFAKAKQFMGKKPQHDDMTLVVVKVKE